MRYAAHLLIYFTLYSVVAQSLNLVVGYCGLFSLAHAAFFALGAYAVALGTLHLGLGWGWAMLAAAVVALVFSLSISLPAWRVRGDAFVLLSLAVQAAVYGGLYNWYSPTAPPASWRNLADGPFGLSAIPPPRPMGIRCDTIGSVLVLYGIIGAAALVMAWRLGSSPWGRLLKATRDDERAARGLGKDTRTAKFQAVAAGAMMVALAGGAYASYVSYIDPSSASLDESVLILSMLLLGGTGNTAGPIVGAAILILTPELLRLIEMPPALAANARQFLFGGFLVLLVHFRPRGIAGEYRLD